MKIENKVKEIENGIRYISALVATHSYFLMKNVEKLEELANVKEIEDIAMRIRVDNKVAMDLILKEIDRLVDIVNSLRELE